MRPIRERLGPPTERSKKIVADACNAIRADINGLHDWASKYCEHHLDRVASDMDLTERFAFHQCRIVELGSAPYMYTVAASRLGHQIHGVDIEPERFSNLIKSERLTVHECDIETSPLPFPDDFADLIVCNEVFEHLRLDINFTFAEILRVCKPSGVLMLSTPNLRSAAGFRNFIRHGRAYSLCGSIYREYNKLHTIGHMGHVREYTFNEVDDFLGEVGFQTTHVIYRGHFLSRRLAMIATLSPSLLPFMTLVAKPRQE